jgi:pyridoxal phosphate enzyme (YggS family)
MSLADNIARVRQQIAEACREAGREPDSVQLMAVSKTHPAEAVLEAGAAGLRIFGENRVQEFAAKREALTAAGVFAAAEPPSFHCIGPLQSNKAVRAAEIFDAVDTVDSLRLAQRLNQAAGAAGKTLAVNLEIKTSPEAAKHGIPPDSPELAALLEHLPDLKHLRVRGLMTVPPFAADPEEVRPYFRRLRELRDSLAARYPRVPLEELSMGMSHDFPVAIEEGATVVRVGTAIFGARPPVARS